MSPELQRIAIAEVCGWKDLGKDAERVRWWLPAPWGNVFESLSYEEILKKRTVYLPDYLNDLNACHDMEKILTDEQQCEFEKRLAYIKRPSSKFKGVLGYSHITFQLVHATAIERAEAFLRILNLWKESSHE